MSLRNVSRFVSFLALAAPLTLGAVGCGPKDEVKHANVKPGSMPEGQEWQGVYYSPLYGYLHLVSDGNSINGGWRTAAGDAYGEMAGTTEGNLFKYEWKERRIGAVGADAVKKGKGYFLYTVPVEGEAPQVKGEWGLGESDAGNTWEAVKQKNMPADLKAVQPDEYEGRVSGGGWDDGEGGGAEGEGEKKKEDEDSSEEQK